MRPGPSAASHRVLRAEPEDAVQARLDATVVHSAYRAALHTVGTVPQLSLREFLR